MDETVQVALITGGLTLAGSVVGGVVVQRSTDRVARVAQLAADRNDLRAVLTDLVCEANAWGSLMETLVPGFARFEWSDLEDFFKTDAGKSLAKSNETLFRLFPEALLKVGDEDILASLTRAAQMHRLAPEQIGVLVMPGRERKLGAALEEDMIVALRHVWAFRQEIAAMAALAAPMLRIRLAPRRWTRWPAQFLRRRR